MPSITNVETLLALQMLAALAPALGLHAQAVPIIDGLHGDRDSLIQLFPLFAFRCKVSCMGRKSISVALFPRSWSVGTGVRVKVMLPVKCRVHRFGELGQAGHFIRPV